MEISTVWLAHDKLYGSLVSIKVLIAEASRQQKELRLLRHLDENIQDESRRGSIIAILDNFTVDGPNGTRLCYVSQNGGPSLSTISDSPVLEGSKVVLPDETDITPKKILLQLRGMIPGL